MAKIYRVRPASAGGPCAVRHPEHGEYTVPNPADQYTESDPLVRAYPWLFVIDAETADQPPVETATRRPGEHRGRLSRG